MFGSPTIHGMRSPGLRVEGQGKRQAVRGTHDTGDDKWNGRHRGSFPGQSIILAHATACLSRRRLAQETRCGSVERFRSKPSQVKRV